MIAILMALLVLAGVVAIFATTGPGRRVMLALGLRDRVAGAAPQRDVDFLLARCGGDPVEAARRVAVERERYPALSEAEHHRRAIRRVLAERAEGGEPGP